MSEEKKHKNYTSADIEKYHKGLLTSQEMNEMERAALDDPFLADAIEGYANVKTNVAEDISELEKKLEQRINEGKVVRMAPPFNIYRALKVAAVVVLVAGGGLLIYQFGFNNSNNSLAKEVLHQTPQQQQQPKTLDTSAVQPNGTTGLSDKIIADSIKVNYQWKSNGNVKSSDKTTTNFTVSAGAAVSPMKDSSAADYATVNGDLDKKAEVSKGFISKSKEPTTPIYRGSTVLENKNLDEVAIKRDTTIQSFKKDMANAATSVNNFYSKEKVANNYFNGRVIDNNKNAVPFANVTNIRDNVGTYADANGYFTLISPDTALDLRIKSVGFQSDTIQFRNNAAAVNQVMLKEDKMNGVVLGKKRLGKLPTPDDNIKVEEPEPADGWSNYSLYLANNLQVPDPIKRKNVAGEVQVSFEVNKLGEPVNIKVEKSLCKECDEEAKRLIQQGPKWKLKKKKNNRVTVTVPFDVTN